MAKTTVVGVRLDQAHRAMLAEMARRNGITMSMQARMILVAAFRKVAINGVAVSKEAWDEMGRWDEALLSEMDVSR